MSSDIRKFEKGIKVEPVSSTGIDAKGEIETLSTGGKLNYHNGTTASPMVTESHQATLTNKTLSGNTATNLISGSGTLTLNTTGTITVPNGTDTLVGKATNDVLSNKTLGTGNILSGSTATSLVSGSGTLTLNTTGTITVPNATDTLVGKATSDVLTNKTLTSPAITTPTGIVKGDVGLGNVDNTSDATKNAAAVALTNKTQITVDNLSLDGNTLASTDSNGNILLDPAGTGLTSIESGPLRLAEQSAPTTPASGYSVFYPKTDGFMYYKNDAGAEVKLQAGSGGINYITNPDFEGDVTGYVTYADAAGTAPVDGTGGSPNITFTRSTSSPLRGTASGLFTKDAANRQGQGVSYDFTIDSADKSKNLKISFDYEASAAYTGSSGAEFMNLYVYDVTNTTQIPTSIIAIPFGSGTQEVTFPATTSTSYRLEFHIAGTGTSAWTFKIDNVNVGPQEITLSAAVGDWTAFTPTGSWSGGNVTYTGFWRRIGDSAEVQVRIACTGLPTESGGYLTINLPSGLTADSTKLAYFSSGAFTIGQGNLLDSSASTQYTLQIALENTTAIRAYLSKITTTYVLNENLFTSAVPVTIATGDSVIVAFKVPISNWSSNIQLANSRVEYASNSSQADSDDTTSFINSPDGSLIQAATLTGDHSRRVRFQNPIQSNDTLQLQVKTAAGWQALCSEFISTGSNQSVLLYSSTNTNGMGLLRTIGTTDADVFFGRYAIGTTNWSGSGTSRWRVVKYSNAVPVDATAFSPSQIIRGTCASFGGSSSGETTVVNYSAAISSTGSDITFTARTTTSGDKYTINTTGLYTIWATGNDNSPGDSYGITVNSSGLSTAVQSLTATQVPIMTYTSTGSNTFTLTCTLNLNVTDVVRIQGETGKTVTGNSNTRFGITRVR